MPNEIKRLERLHRRAIEEALEAAKKADAIGLKIHEEKGLLRQRNMAKLFEFLSGGGDDVTDCHGG